MKKLLLGALLGIFSTFTLAHDVPIKKGMSYLQARQALLNDGWMVTPMNFTEDGKTTCHEGVTNCKEFYEIESCYFEGYCLMYFFHNTKGFLEVSTWEGDPILQYNNPMSVTVDEWKFIDKSPVPNTQKKTSSIPLKKDMPYLQARQLLLKNHWQPEPMNTDLNNKPICHDNKKTCQEMYEIDACISQGKGFCLMYFRDTVHGGFLEIRTEGKDPTTAYTQTNETKIESWRTMATLPNYSDEFEDESTSVNPREQKCLDEREVYRYILSHIAKKSYQGGINEWRREYQNKEISFDLYQLLLKRASIFEKIPNNLYQTEQAREKLLDDLFDVCVKYSK